MIPLIKAIQLLQWIHMCWVLLLLSLVIVLIQVLIGKRQRPLISDSLSPPTAASTAATISSLYQLLLQVLTCC
jgi:hypothetical protein